MGPGLEKTVITKETFTKLSEPGKYPKNYQLNVDTNQFLKFGLEQWGVETTITHTKHYPSSTMGRIKSYYQKDQSTTFSSGCLIRGNLVLTCAHNCYNKQTQEKAKHIWYYPANSTNEDKIIQIKVISSFYPTNYELSLQNEGGVDKKLDYAFLQLQKNIQDEYGYLGIDFSDQMSVHPKLIAGYPKQSNGSLHVYKGEVKTVNGLMNHNMPTHAGVGGAPIIQIRNNQFYVIGIHSFYHKVNNSKGGVKIDMTMMKLINESFPITEEIINFSGKIEKDKVFQKILKQDYSKVCTALLDQNKLDAKKIKDLAELRWDQLRELSLKNNLINQSAVVRLLEMKVKKLQKLVLSGNSLKREGIQALAGNTWSNLNNLSLDNCQLGDEGVFIFFKNKWPSLKTVNLSSNNLAGKAFTNIQNSSVVLHHLILDNNDIDCEAFKQLLKCNLSELQCLSLNYNKLNDRAMAEFVKLDWKKLTKLYLSHNLIQNEGLKMLCKSSMTNIVQLILNCNRIGDAGVQQLLKTTFFSMQLIDLKMNFTNKNKVQDYRNLLSTQFKRANIQI